MVTISSQTIITAAAVLTALGVIGGVALWCVRFVDHNKEQDKELAAIRKEQTTIRKEQTLLCFGVMACLKGLKEQGCNGPVTETLSRFEKHLNKAAHDEEEV